MRYRFRWLCLLAALAVSLGVAAADTSDAQRIEERLPTATKTPAQAPATTSTDDRNAEIDFATFQPFVLRSAAMEGLTAIDPADAEPCVRGLVGRTVGPIELNGLSQCVTHIYRERGFFLSRAFIPAQEVSDGVIKVRAIEGYIFAVAATGLEQADADAQFASALQERPATLATFERGLLLLADRYGLRVKASQLVAEPDDPARYTYKLNVETTPVSWRVFGDNRGTEAHGPEQAFASAAWNSLFGAVDRLAVSVFTTPTDTKELLFADMNYAHGWMSGILWTEFGASISRTNDGAAVSAPRATSDVDRYYGRVTAPLLRSRAQSLWAGLAFDARSTDDFDPPGAFTDERTRVLRGSLTYTLVEDQTRIDMQVEAARGLDIFDASENGDAGLTRLDGRPQFTKLRIDAALLQQMSDRWQLAISGSGQLADGALVASEEFGVGGSRFGRAYDYSEIIGDDGIAGAIELRWTWPNAFDLLASLQLYGFADAGRIWNAGYAPGTADADLTSAGGGLRITPIPGINANLEAAKPLSRISAAEGDRSPRVFVSLSMGW